MTIYQEFLKARRGSKARGELAKRYAAEKGIRLAQAYRRLYKERAQLDAYGDLIRKVRADKGQPSLYTIEQVAQVRKALQEDREKTYKQIAAAIGVSYYFIIRVAAGRYDKK